MNNLSSYCGLVDAKIGASLKELPVKDEQKVGILVSQSCDSHIRKKMGVMSSTCSFHIGHEFCVVDFNILFIKT